MPYYQWKGLTEEKKLVTGRDYAQNSEELQTLLKNKQIDLIVLTLYQFSNSACYKEKAIFSNHMSHLLASNIRIIQALEITTELLKDSLFKTALLQSMQCIQEGKSFPEALAIHEGIDEIMLSMITAGHESGSLKAAFKLLGEYYAHIDELIRQLRTTLFIPLLTLAISIVTTGLLLFIVFPRFEYFFTLLNAPIPIFLGFVLQLRTFFIIFFGSFGLLIFLSSTSSSFRKKILSHVPFIKNFYRDYVVTRVIQIISMLLTQGISLHRTLLAIPSVLPQTSKELLPLIQQVEQGNALSDALSKNSLFSHYKEIITLCKVGEATGNLDMTMREAARITNQHFMYRLKSITQRIPIIVLIIVTVLLAFLIISLYLPLLSLTQATF